MINLKNYNIESKSFIIIIIGSFMFIIYLIVPFFFEPLIGLIQILSWIGFVLMIGLFMSYKNRRERSIRKRFRPMVPFDMNENFYYCDPYMPTVIQDTSFETLGFDIPEYEISQSFGNPFGFCGSFLELTSLKFTTPLSPKDLEFLETVTYKENSNWEKVEDGFILTLSQANYQKKCDYTHKIWISKEGMGIYEGKY